MTEGPVRVGFIGAGGFARTVGGAAKESSQV